MAFNLISLYLRSNYTRVIVKNQYFFGDFLQFLFILVAFATVFLVFYVLTPNIIPY